MSLSVSFRNGVFDLFRFPFMISKFESHGSMFLAPVPFACARASPFAGGRVPVAFATRNLFPTGSFDQVEMAEGDSPRVAVRAFNNQRHGHVV